MCFANDAGRSAPIDWRQIRQVRLFCEPVGPEPSIFAAKDTRPLAYFCELTLRNSKRIMLGNGPLLAPGWSIALRPAYRAFVLELHERLHTARGRTRFRAGSTWRHFLAGHFWSSWEIHGFGYFVLIPRDFAAFRRDFPRRYRPAKVPQRLLPP